MRRFGDPSRGPTRDRGAVGHGTAPETRRTPPRVTEHAGVVATIARIDASRRALAEVSARGNGRTRHEPRTDRAGDARAVGITAPRRPIRRALVRVIARGVSAGSIGMSHAPLGCRADGRRSSRDDLTRLEPASGWRSARRRWIARKRGAVSGREACQLNPIEPDRMCCRKKSNWQIKTNSYFNLDLN